MPKPVAKQLKDMHLAAGWVVGDLEYISEDRLIFGYQVEHPDGRKGYIKAFDFSGALAAEDFALAMKPLNDAYVYERNLHELCETHNMDRVASAIDSGQVRPDGQSIPVPYLLFERADGDLRSHVQLGVGGDAALILRALHHIATGLFQLHRSDIAHQDLKPGNVLVFGQQVSKIGDLGRASRKGIEFAHDANAHADASYAPPELLYGFFSNDWNVRRFGCDVYLLGSMIVYLFAGLAITPQLYRKLNHQHRWGVWSGSYLEVEPYVREAFRAAVADFEQSLPTALPEDTHNKLVETVKQLCDPDPSRRGHPLTRRHGGNPFSLERYVALFDLLARYARR